ncbi:MAG: DUF4325 domain-containing protein [Gammaproteobacteria bacterium]|nr:DUF4325 domain-containing protein [Gammaproteobacteria bacterium]
MNTKTVIIPANAATTRKDGSELRRHFTLAFRSPDDVVTVDCSQVMQLGDEFIDECFGMLTLDYGLAAFYKHVHLLHATDKHLFTIAYHINKREQQRVGRLAMTRNHIPQQRPQASPFHYA